MSLAKRLERIEALLALQAKEVLTVKETAALTGRSESRIRHLVAAREIPHYKNEMGRVSFLKPEVEKWMLGERIPTAAETESMAATYIATKRVS